MFRALLCPSSYEQFYIQTFHQEGKLIPEQYPGELNPLFQTAIHPLHTASKDQSCYSLQPGHLSSLPAPNFQPTATQGMYISAAQHQLTHQQYIDSQVCYP